MCFGTCCHRSEADPPNEGDRRELAHALQIAIEVRCARPYDRLRRLRARSRDEASESHDDETQARRHARITPHRSRRGCDVGCSGRKRPHEEVEMQRVVSLLVQSVRRVARVVLPPIAIILSSTATATSASAAPAAAVLVEDIDTRPESSWCGGGHGHRYARRSGAVECPVQSRCTDAARTRGISIDEGDGSTSPDLCLSSARLVADLKSLQGDGRRPGRCAKQSILVEADLREFRGHLASHEGAVVVPTEARSFVVPR